MSRRASRREIWSWWPVRPAPASPISRSTWPSDSMARSSTPTRCSSTGGWTSAPRNCRRSLRRGIPHHLLDVLDISERASVAAYQRQARRLVEDVLDPRPDPVAGGRIRPVHQLRHRQHRVSRAPIRRCAPRWRPNWPRVGPAGTFRTAAGRGSGGRRGDRAGQRPPPGPGPRGHGRDRAAVLRDHADPGTAAVSTRSWSASTGRPQALDDRLEQRVSGHGRGRIPRRGPTPRRDRPSRRGDRIAGAGLSADAGRAGRLDGRLPRRLPRPSG